jgi:hypothetical protein
MRATTAAPMYFTPLEIKDNTGYKYTFQDAGVSGFSNPSALALDEAEKLFQDDEVVLVSLGTGLSTLLADDGPKRGGSVAISEDDAKGFAQKIFAALGGKSSQKHAKIKGEAHKLAKQFLGIANDTELVHLDMASRFTREFVSLCPSTALYSRRK